MSSSSGPSCVHVDENFFVIHCICHRHYITYCKREWFKWSLYISFLSGRNGVKARSNGLERKEKGFLGVRLCKKAPFLSFFYSFLLSVCGRSFGENVSCCSWVVIVIFHSWFSGKDRHTHSHTRPMRDRQHIHRTEKNVVVVRKDLFIWCCECSFCSFFSMSLSGAIQGIAYIYFLSLYRAFLRI